MNDTTKKQTDRTKRASNEDLSADAFSSVLDTIHFKGGCFARPSVRAPWGIEFDRDELLETMFPETAGDMSNFHAVLKGSALLRHQGETIALSDGDVVFFKRFQDHALVSDERAVPLRLPEDLKHLEHTETTSNKCHITNHFGQNDGPETILISGSVFHPSQPEIHPLLTILPDKIILQKPADDSRRRVDQILGFLAAESRSGRVASEALIGRLCDILFIQILRYAVEHSLVEGPSWICGLREPRIQAALMAIHSEPEKAWDVTTLARCAGMSRTNFARRFVEKIGEPPLAYLTRWRMHLAAGKLLSGSDSIATIAESVGYATEIGFSRAFSNMVGTTPAKYRRQTDFAQPSGQR